MRRSLVLSRVLLGAMLVAGVRGRARAQSTQTVAELLASGDRAWASAKYDEAMERYDAALQRDSTSLRALFRVATVLGWHRDFDRSASLFRVYLRRAPGDDDARIGLARTLAWRGEYARAIAICDSVLARDPRNRDAQELGAQALAWSVAASPSFEPTVSTTDDSDDNRSTTYLVRGGLGSPRNARLVGEASYRVTEFGAERGSSATLRASSSWAPTNGQWAIRADVGAARLDASGAPYATRVLPLLAARFTERPTPSISLGGSVAHAPFDETTALILAGIATTSIGADADVALRPLLRLAGDASWTTLSGGSGPNSRVAASGSLRWSPTSVVSLAGNVRGFGYGHAAFDGYFAPKQYVLAEMSAHLHLGGELGWGFDSQLGLGNQTIVAFDDSRAGRFAQRMSAAIAYRPAPGMEWAVSGEFANVASPTTISSTDYRAYTISIKGRVRL